MKNHTNKFTKLFAGALLAGAILGLTNSGFADNGPHPDGGNCSNNKNDLATWMETYQRWFYGGITVPMDANGNAVVGNTVLLAQPSADGDGTPASLNVTLKSNQPFVLPFFSLLGTSYSDGTPNDPFEPVGIFQTLEITFTIDGHTVVNHHNAMNYFSKFSFVPPIPVNDPPFNGIIWCEDVGMVHEPLSPGKHTFMLHVKNTQLAFGSIIEYNNTWNVTVKSGCR